MIGSMQPWGGACADNRRRSRRRMPLALGLALGAVLVTGCGNDGDISVVIPTPTPDSSAVIRGTVYAPNGDVAGGGGRMDWLRRFELLPRAYASLNPNVLPVGPGTIVSLTQISEVDASDGRIDSPLLIAEELTNIDGQYRFTGQAAEEIDGCRMMVSVGGGELLLRAFVASAVTDIDVASETTVRVVLNRLTQAPPAHLCDFSSSALLRLQDIVANATFTATSSGIPEMNHRAYQMAVADPCVQDNLDKVMGMDRDGTPSVCLRFYPR
jgi:hypothetical protein